MSTRNGVKFLKYAFEETIRLELQEMLGRKPYERTESTENYRNGSYDRNLETRLPRKIQKDCLDHVKRVFYANSYEEALDRFNDWKSYWNKIAPGAVHCLEKDLDSVLQLYRFPKHHWKTIRTTNIIERTFKEFRR